MAKRSTKIQHRPSKGGWAPSEHLAAPIEQLMERFPPGMVAVILDHRAKVAAGEREKERQRADRAEVAELLTRIEAYRAAMKGRERQALQRFGGRKGATAKASGRTAADARMRATIARVRAGSRRRLTDTEVAARVAAEHGEVVDRKRVRRLEGKPR